LFIYLFLINDVVSSMRRMAEWLVHKELERMRKKRRSPVRPYYGICQGELTKTMKPSRWDKQRKTKSGQPVSRLQFESGTTNIRNSGWLQRTA